MQPYSVSGLHLRERNYWRYRLNGLQRIRSHGLDWLHCVFFQFRVQMLVPLVPSSWLISSLLTTAPQEECVFVFDTTCWSSDLGFFLFIWSGIFFVVFPSFTSRSLVYVVILDICSSSLLISLMHQEVYVVGTPFHKEFEPCLLDVISWIGFELASYCVFEVGFVLVFELQVEVLGFSSPPLL